MRYFPVHLDLKGRRVVVVGGGKVAFRKIQELLESEAQVTVVAPGVSEEIEILSRREKIRLYQRAFRPGDLRGSWLAIAATDDRQLHKKISKMAQKSHLWLNVVDDTELCTFIFPAVVARGSFVVTVGTGGASPALARKVREDLEKKFGEEYGRLAHLMARLRKIIPPDKKRSEKFNRFVRSPVLYHLRKGDTRAVKQLVRGYFGI